MTEAENHFIGQKPRHLLEPPSMSTTDTIAAIATPPGQGGVGIVRISGSNPWKIADEIFQGLDPSGAREASRMRGSDRRKRQTF